MPWPTVHSDLTEKQLRFAQEYVLNGGNGTAAARDAGYECNSANSFSVTAYDNLRNPKILAICAELRKDIAAEFGVTREEVITGLREAREIAFNREPIYDREGNPTGEFKCDLPSGIRAIELLGKTQGLFIDRNETSLNVEELAGHIAKQRAAIKEQAEGEQSEGKDA